MRRRPAVALHPATILMAASLLGGAAGAAGCGWKAQTGPSAVSREVLVILQNQHGDILGSRVYPRTSEPITVTLADAGGVPFLSSKYIAVWREPTDGRIRKRVATTNAGSASFQAPEDGTAVRVVFISTADLPERLMDCSYGTYSGIGFQRVGRASTGLRNTNLDLITLLDGDYGVLAGAADDLNRAMVDAHGVVLGRLTSTDATSTIDTLVGFSDPPVTDYTYPDEMSYWWLWSGVWSVLVNPRDPPGLQTRTAVKGFVCPGGCSESRCGAPLVDYLLDPASGYRLSSQGVSFLRFLAYLGSVASYTNP